MAGLFGLILGYAAIRFRVEGNPVVDQIDALLPQTQCGLQKAVGWHRVRQQYCPGEVSWSVPVYGGFA